jgi:hypothetical protein
MVCTRLLPSDEIVRAILAWGEKAKDPFDKAQADFIAIILH